MWGAILHLTSGVFVWIRFSPAELSSSIDPCITGQVLTWVLATFELSGHLWKRCRWWFLDSPVSLAAVVVCGGLLAGLWFSGVSKLNSRIVSLYVNPWIISPWCRILVSWTSPPVLCLSLTSPLQTPCWSPWPVWPFTPATSSCRSTSWLSCTTSRWSSDTETPSVHLWPPVRPSVCPSLLGLRWDCFQLRGRTFSTFPKLIRYQWSRCWSGGKVPPGTVSGNSLWLGGGALDEGVLSFVSSI